MSDLEIKMIIDRIDVMEKNLTPALSAIATHNEQIKNIVNRVDDYKDTQIPKCEKRFEGMADMVALVTKHEKVIMDTKEEKLNTVKASQYRIAIIVSVVMGAVTILGNIFITYLKVKVWH